MKHQPPCRQGARSSTTPAPGLAKPKPPHMESHPMLDPSYWKADLCLHVCKLYGIDKISDHDQLKGSSKMSAIRSEPKVVLRKP